MATPAGRIFLQSDCSVEQVGRLRADSGLRAFARHAEREYELLLSLKQRADCRLALAYTAEGTIVGQATRVPADGWWGGIEHTCEITIEVSVEWRKKGIAREMLYLIAQEDDWERMIVLAQGLCWHWDTEGLGINSFRYREVIKQLFGAHGFDEYVTAEGNIQMEPANILLVRIGSQVERETIRQFFQRLLWSDGLPGL
jgi:acetoin utilization protein AcuA